MKGTAFETLVFHELRVFNHTVGRNRPIRFYRTPAGAEIDFVIETRPRTAAGPAHVVCIEVKLAPRWDRKWEQPMRSLREDKRIRVDRMIGVYSGSRACHYDGLDVLPVLGFLNQLYEGRAF